MAGSRVLLASPKIDFLFTICSYGMRFRLFSSSHSLSLNPSLAARGHQVTELQL
jgi:hypothetical protein